MYIEPKLQKISLNFIDADDKSFCFTDERSGEVETLKYSVSQLGIISPLILQPVCPQKKYRIIHGFKRFSVAKDLKFSSVPAWILKEGLSSEKILRLILLAHSKPLSIVEKAKFLRIATSFNYQPKKIIKEFGSFLEIHSLEAFGLYLSISKYNPKLLFYISTHGLSLNQALCFQKLSEKEQEFILHLATSLNLKGYDLHTIITNLKEIATREEKKVMEVIQTLNLNDILEEKRLTRSQKIEKIKEILEKRRYPLLCNINKKLEELKKNLKFSFSCDISWDKKLEKSGLNFSFSVRNPQNLKKLVKDLLRKENIHTISNMLRIYYEGFENKEGAN